MIVAVIVMVCWSPVLVLVGASNRRSKVWSCPAVIVAIVVADAVTIWYCVDQLSEDAFNLYVSAPGPFPEVAALQSDASLSLIHI